MFTRWSRRFFQPVAPIVKAKAKTKLAFDRLEDRTVPATLTVNSGSGEVFADAHLTLREAVAIVNAGNTNGVRLRKSRSSTAP